MKRVQYLIVAVLSIIVVLLLIDGCRQRAHNKNLVDQLSEYKIENQNYRSERQKDSSLIVTQNQTILSQKEALKLGLLELDNKIKQVQSQLQAKLKISVVEKDVPFIPTNYADTSGWVRDRNGTLVRTDSISVPQDYGLIEKWFKVKGTIKKTGIRIDTLDLPAKFTVTYGKEKSGFLGLGRTPVVQVKSDNPYIDVSSLNNIVVKKPKNILNSPFLYLGTGIILGIIVVK